MTAGYKIISADGGWHFELYGLPDRLLLSGNTCTTRSRCLETVGNLRLLCDSPFDGGQGSTYPKFTVEHTDMGFFVLVLKGKNGRRIAVGPECRSPSAAAEALPEISRSARTAPIIN